MPWTKTADRRTIERVDGVTVAGRSSPLSRARVIGAAVLVLGAERRRAVLSVTFVGRDRMRVLHARWLGQRRTTDVIAFPLVGPGGALAGDIYICPWMAAREARERKIPLGQELLRLVVHGVLHVLGYAHPAGPERADSAMWRRQERYLRALR